jgi:hypothetical protein
MKKSSGVLRESRTTGCQDGSVELDDLLAGIDRATANLAKVEKIWERAHPHLPTGPASGSSAEYEDLCRMWLDLLEGLPKIDGWTITDALPDMDEIGRAFLDYAEIGEPPFRVLDAIEEPNRQIAEYSFRLKRARRRAVRKRLDQLADSVEVALPHVLAVVPDKPGARIASAEAERITEAIREIELLIGDSIVRTGRWSDLRRHLRFGQGGDWTDIRDHDWPSVRSDIETAARSDSDPLPVPDIDLGVAASGEISGSVASALPWNRLDDAGFERLLYDLLRSFPEHQNVQWLTQTRAPDRGRDLSMERALAATTGSVRIERVIVQAKHWLSRSVNLNELSSVLAQIKLWEPPVVRVLILATSGRFTSDAVAFTERHNDSALVPHIELWPDSQIEALLSEKPQISAAHGLRD